MANIHNLAVLPRPRNAWQAMDAGFALARAHFLTLLLLWCGFAVPAFALYTWIQASTGSEWAILLWWWFLPLYELPMLMYLSRALFAEKATLMSCWRAALGNFWRLLRTYLGFFRFSPARSMTSNVVFLEKLTGKARRNRVGVLTMEKTRSIMLTTVCLHVVYILIYGFIGVAVLFFPHLIETIDWAAMFDPGSEYQSVSPWFLWLSGASTFLAVALVAPFYVAGGFLLYINRRMQLEAWDIEHRFRAVAQRAPANRTVSRAAALSLMMVLCTGLTPLPEPAMAQNRAAGIPSMEQATKLLKDIKSHEEFGGTVTRKVPDINWETGDDDAELPNLALFSDLLQAIANGFQVFLWAAVAIFLILLLITLKQFMPDRFRRKTTRRPASHTADATAHPLTSDLPTDIIRAANHALEQGDRRQSLSLLFRGALRSVMQRHDLEILKSATEADCLQFVEQNAAGSHASFFRELVQHWQLEAYAHQPRAKDTITQLIGHWATAFGETQPRPQVEQS